MMCVAEINSSTGNSCMSEKQSRSAAQAARPGQAPAIDRSRPSSRAHPTGPLGGRTMETLQMGGRGQAGGRTGRGCRMCPARSQNRTVRHEVGGRPRSADGVSERRPRHVIELSHRPSITGSVLCRRSRCASGNRLRLPHGRARAVASRASRRRGKCEPSATGAPTGSRRTKVVRPPMPPKRRRTWREGGVRTLVRRSPPHRIFNHWGGAEEGTKGLQRRAVPFLPHHRAVAPSRMSSPSIRHPRERDYAGPVRTALQPLGRSPREAVECSSRR